MLSAKIATGVFAIGATAATSGIIAEGVLTSLQWLHAKLAVAAVASVLLIDAAQPRWWRLRGGSAAVAALAAGGPWRIAHAAAPPISGCPTSPITARRSTATPIDNTAMIASFGADGASYFGGRSEAQANGLSAAVVMSLVDAPKDAGLLATSVSALPYRGKRIRYSAYLKSKDVERVGMLSLQIFCPDDNLFAHDEMDGHEVVGTRDWRRFDIVSDVPDNATAIAMRMIPRRQRRAVG